MHSVTHIPQSFYDLVLRSIKSVKFNNCRWIRGRYVVKFIDNNIRTLETANIVHAVHKDYESLMQMEPESMTGERVAVKVILQKKSLSMVEEKILSSSSCIYAQNRRNS